MTKKTGKGYQSEIAASIQEMMEGAAAAGVIDEQTVREFDIVLADKPMRSPDVFEQPSRNG